MGANVTQLALLPLPAADTNNDSDEWYTPHLYIDAAREVMNETIELDPASSKAANEIVKARYIFTIDDNGLSRKWQATTLWLNPPYSDPAPWLAKLCAAYDAGDVLEAIALIPPGVDRQWFHDIISRGVACFHLGRIRFYRADGRSSSSPTQGNVFVYLGPQREKFARVFGRFGTIMGVLDAS